MHIYISITQHLRHPDKNKYNCGFYLYKPDFEYEKPSRKSLKKYSFWGREKITPIAFNKNKGDIYFTAMSAIGIIGSSSSSVNNFDLIKKHTPNGISSENLPEPQ